LTESRNLTTLTGSDVINCLSTPRRRRLNKNPQKGEKKKEKENVPMKMLVPKYCDFLDIF